MYIKKEGIVYFSLQLKKNKIKMQRFCRPELFDFDAQQKSSVRARLDNSFKMAEKHFGVPRYLESSGLFICFFFNLKEYWNKICTGSINYVLSLVQYIIVLPLPLNESDP